jgi:Resolvase, N terminal domain
MFRAGLYARVSTNDQQTLAMQNRAMREYAARRGWTIALQIREVNSGRYGGKPARKCWKPPADGRLMWCWFGGWTDGADR